MRAFGLVLIVALAGCGSPQSFEELTPKITSAEVTGPNLMIDARLDPGGFPAATMLNLGELIETVARGLQEDVPGPTAETQHVQLMLGITSQDRLGNDAVVDFGTIRLPVADLKAANLDTLSGTSWLELVDEVSPSAGSTIAIEYCGDGEDFALHPVWCRAVAEGLGI